MCEYIERCAPRELAFYPGGDVEGCAEAHDCLQGVWPRECPAAIATLECRRSPHFVPKIPECQRQDEQATPRAGEGEDCAEAWCDEGLWCSHEGEGPVCDRPVCRPHAREGEACGRQPCERGLSCHPEQSVCARLGQAGESCPRVGCEYPLTCIEDRCTPRREPGQPCEFDSMCEGVCDDGGHCAERIHAALGASCAERDCEPGLLCRDGRCRAWGDLGAACTVGSVPEAPERLGFSVAHDCRLGLACVEGHCERTTCGDASAGGACDRAFTRCREGLYCGPDGRCEPVPMPRLGETCDPMMTVNYGFSTCLEGYCARDGAVCTAYAVEGQECVVRPCRAELRCVAGTCQRPHSVGDTCESSSECAAFASCDAESHVCRCGR